ncbi:unnamed protein product [Auanema sp. JU1783]|nr:unnamed protein product [Auanema sp. JU1783]
MTSVLSSFFSRDPKAGFAYELPSQNEDFIQINGIKLAKSFRKSEPEVLATVLWTSTDLAELRAQAQKLKTMRHPNIIAFQDSIEIENTFYLITERCIPLSHYFRTRGVIGDQKEFFVSWGLFQVMNCLKFLHEANLSHENIREGVYVTEGGDWKLSCLNKIVPFQNAQNDLNQLGMVLWEIFNGFNAGVSKAQAPGKIPKRLVELYKKIVAPSASRLSASELIREQRMTGGYFKNKFVDTLLFLEEFQLKESSEKQTFFMHLRENLDIFPDDIAKYKILPKLIMTYEYGDAGPNILIPLFKLGRLLDEDEYQKRIVPCLVKLFHSSDRTTRVKLLERIDEFSAHLTPAVVNDKIFSNLITGFLDTSPAVRESTVKAMVPLAEKLNFHNLNVELMKYLAKLQGGDEHGGIRTNTTICLGKIGSLLDPAKRQQILLSAFTRGMKDPFPPARLAALLALSATQQFYSIGEIANRILPSLSPLCCDPEQQVREQAFKAIKGFLSTLERISENPELATEHEAQVRAGGKSLLSSDKVPQWASWALKSISGKFYKGPTSPESAVAGEKKEEDERSPSRASERSVNSVTPSKFNKPVPASTTDADGWGDLDDDDNWADADDHKEAEMNAAENDEEDDWSSGWETSKPDPLPTPTPTPASVPAVKKSLRNPNPVKKLSATKVPVDKVSDMFADTSITPTPNSDWNQDTSTNDWENDGWGSDDWGQAPSTKPAKTLSLKPNRDKHK